MTATPGPAAALSKMVPDSLVVAPGASTLLTVRAVDQFGNPVAGVVVSWAATGGALTVTTTTTGSSGNAEVVFTSETTPRSYTVTATAPGLDAAAFSIVAR